MSQSIIERLATIPESASIAQDRLAEQIKIAEDLNMPGVVWALKMRSKIKILKAMGYQPVTVPQIELDLKLNKEIERLGTFNLAGEDYGRRHYAGFMPFGCLLTVKELLEHKLCDMRELRVWHPLSVPLREDPILTVCLPDMERLTFMEEGGSFREEDMLILKVWQWD